MRIPIAHGEGCYFADEATLGRLQAKGQVLWQYVDARGEATERANPNGSLLNIAGIANETFNVAGLMPHPDRASESVLGSTDGRYIFESMVATLEERRRAAA
jgi:phosphoribosylformylglycinamidine synthase